MATPNIVPRSDSEGGLGTASKYWASAYIDDVFVSKIGRDTDNYLDFSTDNEIQLRVNGNHEIIFNANQIHPVSDDGIALGYAGRGFSDLFLASGAVINFDSGNFTLSHGSGGIGISDGMQFRIGSGNDLRLYHTGGVSYVSNEGSGSLEIRNLVDDADVILSCDDGSGGTAAYITLDGSSGYVDINRTMYLDDNIDLRIGTAGDLELSHDGANSYITQQGTGDLYIQNKTDNKDIIFQSDDGSGGVETYFFLDGSATSGSPVTVFPDNSILYFGDGLDFSIGHNGSNSVITNTSGNVFIDQQTDNGSVYFRCDDGSGGITNYFQVDGSAELNKFHKNTKHTDGIAATFGDGGDLSISHDGNNSYIVANGTGDLYIRQMTDDKDIYFQSDDGSGGVSNYFTVDGSATRVYFERNIRMVDNGQIQLGSSGDMQIYHNATDSVIQNTTGDLYIANGADDKDIIFQSDDGSGGLETYFFLDGSNGWTTFPDNKKATFGTGNDLQIYHDGTTSEIRNTNGNIKIRNFADDSDIIFETDDGSGGNTTYLQLDGSEVSTKILTQKVIMSNLPTSDPSNAGQLWNDSGTLKISAG